MQSQNIILVFTSLLFLGGCGFLSWLSLSFSWSSGLLSFGWGSSCGLNFSTCWLGFGTSLWSTFGTSLLSWSLSFSLGCWGFSFSCFGLFFMMSLLFFSFSVFSAEFVIFFRGFFSVSISLSFFQLKNN